MEDLKILKGLSGPISSVTQTSGVIRGPNIGFVHFLSSALVDKPGGIHFGAPCNVLKVGDFVHFNAVKSKSSFTLGTITFEWIANCVWLHGNHPVLKTLRTGIIHTSIPQALSGTTSSASPSSTSSSTSDSAPEADKTIILKKLSSILCDGGKQLPLKNVQEKFLYLPNLDERIRNYFVSSELKLLNFIKMHPDNFKVISSESPGCTKSIIIGLNEGKIFKLDAKVILVKDRAILQTMRCLVVLLQTNGGSMKIDSLVDYKLQLPPQYRDKISIVGVLQRFPSLFTINKDAVSVSDISKFEMNAVLLLESRIKASGGDVYIKDLCGHMSCLEPVVQKLVGCSADSIKKLLIKYPNNFTVLGDKVKLNCNVVLLKQVANLEPKNIKAEPLDVSDSSLLSKKDFNKNCDANSIHNDLEEKRVLRGKISAVFTNCGVIEYGHENDIIYFYKGDVVDLSGQENESCNVLSVLNVGDIVEFCKIVASPKSSYRYIATQVVKIGSSESDKMPFCDSSVLPLSAAERPKPIQNQNYWIWGVGPLAYITSNAGFIQRGDMTNSQENVYFKLETFLNLPNSSLDRKTLRLDEELWYIAYPGPENAKSNWKALAVWKNNIFLDLNVNNYVSKDYIMTMGRVKLVNTDGGVMIIEKKPDSDSDKVKVPFTWEAVLQHISNNATTVLKENDVVICLVDKCKEIEAWTAECIFKLENFQNISSHFRPTNELKIVPNSTDPPSSHTECLQFSDSTSSNSMDEIMKITEAKNVDKIKKKSVSLVIMNSSKEKNINDISDSAKSLDLLQELNSIDSLEHLGSCSTPKGKLLNVIEAPHFEKDNTLDLIKSPEISLKKCKHRKRTQALKLSSSVLPSSTHEKDLSVNPIVDLLMIDIPEQIQNCNILVPSTILTQDQRDKVEGQVATTDKIHDDAYIYQYVKEGIQNYLKLLDPECSNKAQLLNILQSDQLCSSSNRNLTKYVDTATQTTSTGDIISVKLFSE